MIGIVLVAIVVIGGILLFYSAPSKTPSQSVILTASDIHGDNWTASDGDNYILNTSISSDSAAQWFHHMNGSGELMVKVEVYHFSSNDEARKLMEESNSNRTILPMNTTVTTVDLGNSCLIYQFHGFPQLYDYPGQSNSTMLELLKSDFVVSIHFFWSTDKMNTSSEVLRIATLQADKITNQ